MDRKEFLTTGEVSQQLKISRSTVSRKYDKGVFYGKTNPITGERLISRASVLAFMEKYNLKADSRSGQKKTIAMVTGSAALKATANNAFDQDDRTDLITISTGCDALVFCSKQKPHLLIIDAELPDIPCEQVIRHLRKSRDHKNLKIVLVSKDSDAVDAIELGAHKRLSKKELDAIQLAKAAYALLRMPKFEPAEEQQFTHQRNARRINISLPVRVALYDIQSSNFMDHGSAVIDNISMTGARLSNIQLTKDSLPTESFRLLLEVDDSPLEQWTAPWKVVRTSIHGSLSAGVKFAELVEPNDHALSALFSAKQSTTATTAAEQA